MFFLNYVEGKQVEPVVRHKRYVIQSNWKVSSAVEHQIIFPYELDLLDRSITQDDPRSVGGGGLVSYIRSALRVMIDVAPLFPIQISPTCSIPTGCPTNAEGR